jgi:N-terminal region of Chorein or VPS13
MSSYISSLLNRRLPAAVHDFLDLPTDQLAATTAAPLQLSLAWGNLTISGVHFKSSLLQRLLGLPLKLTEAEINRASLLIPWFTLLWRPVVLELDGITVVVAAEAGSSATSASRAHTPPKQRRKRPQKQSASTPAWLHALLRWALQKVVVRVTAVSVRYESVGRCPYQQSGPAAVELWLGALELNGIPTVSAAHSAGSSSDNRPLGGTLTLQELAVGVESLRAAAGADTKQPSWLLLQPTTVGLSACVDMQADRRQITAALAVHGTNAQQPVAVVLPQTAVALAWGVAEELMLLLAATDADSITQYDTAEVWYDAVETEEARTASACENANRKVIAAVAAAAAADAASGTTAVAALAAPAAAAPLKLVFTAEIVGVSILCTPDAIYSAASLKPVHTIIQRVRLSVDTVLSTAERQAVAWLDVLSAAVTQTGRSKPLIVLQHSVDSTKQAAVWLRVDAQLQGSVVTASCKLGDSSVTAVLAACRAVTSCTMPSTALQLAMACNTRAKQQRTAAATVPSKSSAAATTTADTVKRQPLEYSIDVSVQSVTVKLPIEPMKDSSRAVCIAVSGIAAAVDQRLINGSTTASLLVGGLMVCRSSSVSGAATAATSATAASTTICSVDDLLAVQLRDRTLTVAVAHITATATAQQIIETAWACGAAVGGVHYTPYVQLKRAAAVVAAAVRTTHIMLPQCDTVTNSLQLQWSGLHIAVLPSNRHNRVGVGRERLLYTMPWCSVAAAKTESSCYVQPLMTLTIGDVHVSTSSTCTVNSSSSSSSSSSSTNRSKRKLHPLHSELELTVASVTVKACTAGISTSTTQQQQQQRQQSADDSQMLQMVSIAHIKLTKQTDLQSLTATTAATLSIGTLHTVSSVHVHDVTMQLEPVLLGRLVHLAVACGAAVRVGRESIECTLALALHKQQQAALLPATCNSRCANEHSAVVSAVSSVLSPDRHSIGTDMNITVDSVVLGMRCQVSCHHDLTYMYQMLDVRKLCPLYAS